MGDEARIEILSICLGEEKLYICNLPHVTRNLVTKYEKQMFYQTGCCYKGGAGDFIDSSKRLLTVC